MIYLVNNTIKIPYKVIDDINSTGYGLTFGIHSRIDITVRHVLERVPAIDK